MITPKSYLILLFGIFSIQLNAQKTKFVSKTIGASIKVLSRKINDNQSQAVLNTSPGMGLSGSMLYGANKGKTDTFFVGIDSGFYKCNTEETLILLEKQNFKSQTKLVKLAEVRSSKKRVVFEKLETLPHHLAEDAFIEIDDVAILLAKKKYIQHYYESEADYQKGKIEHSYISDEEINVKKSIFDKGLNDFLVNTGHLDTLNKISLNNFSKIKLNLTLNSITEYKFSYYCSVEIKSKIVFPSNFGTIKEKEYTGKSYIGYDNSNEKESNNKALIENALEHIIVSMLNDPELVNYLKNPEKEQKKMVDAQPEIFIKNQLSTASNLENATNAVVTIIEKNGHGSGCIISNDGYVVTNYHVVGKDTAEVYAVFTNGAKRRCRFIRANPIYDLSLLKIDTAIANPLKINNSKNISVGSDVFAIGTPEDISLGQSITKGIVSAKRTFENKIYIQSDVSVNSGNSGGAMTNKDGELIGIVNAKLVGYGVEGVSFAIPVYYIEEFLRLKLQQ